MKCVDCSMLLAESQIWMDFAKRSEVIEHLADCGNCRNALTALDALHAVRELPVPQPGNAAITSVIEAAVAEQRTSPIRPAGFWTGLAAGAAAVSTIALLWLTLIGPRDQPAAVIPEVAMALHDPGLVSIGIESAEALSGAEIHVSLRGAIDLQGFEGQRDVRWATDLERGINELSLPVVAIGPGGGRLIVEVYHGDKLKAFAVDVRALRGDDAA
jgi:hypothetical protein